LLRIDLPDYRRSDSAAAIKMLDMPERLEALDREAQTV
jgi:hypothetical protein